MTPNLHCVPKKTCDHIFDDKLKLGLLTINRLIDPGRRIEYNFLGSINRKAASPRHADVALPRHAAHGAAQSRDTRTRAQDRLHVPTTINIEIQGKLIALFLGNHYDQQQPVL